MCNHSNSNLPTAWPCVAAPTLSSRPVCSALISIFKWTQFLFESELKVKQLSRRKNCQEGESERKGVLREEESGPDFILLLLHAIAPLSFSFAL